MEEKRNSRIKPSCEYLSATFLRIFDEYATARLKKQTTKDEYWDKICYLCNYAKKDFLKLTASDAADYFANTDISIGTKRARLRTYRAIARYIDQMSMFYGLTPDYSRVFLSVNLGEPDMYYRLEDLPAFKDIDVLFCYFKEQHDLATFIAMALALRCCLTTEEIVSLDKKMLFQDLSGSYGLRLHVSDLNDRFIKIPDDVAQLMVQYVNKRLDDDPHLLLNAYGKPLGVRTLQSRLQLACKACGEKIGNSFTFNGLRVLGTTLMLKKGAPVQKVMEYTYTESDYWIMRYNKVIKELDDSPVDYVHLKIMP
ncbi:tyrosine-type recombinase/integrase (plasmid) [Enterocloster clostridioformis]